MARRKKEAHFDNINPADLNPHAKEPQLRVVQDIPPQAGTEPEPGVPPGLQLTEKEQARVARLKEQGYDAGTALIYGVAGNKARRIIGHHYLVQETTRLDETIKDRKSREEKAGLPTDEVIVLLRETDPEKIGQKPTGEGS